MPDMLSRLRALPKNIRIGVVGIGNIGRGIVYQVDATPGMECVAIADAHLERATAWAERLGRVYAVVETSIEMNDAIRKGLLAVCSDGMLVSSCDQVDVLVDSSTGGAQFAI